MNHSLSPIIQIEELTQIIDKKDLIIIHIGNGKNAKSNYTEEHIHQAHYLDLNSDLSECTENAAKGGRHPLPSVAKFSSTVGKVGITPSDHVVVYDEKNSGDAARFWWMMKSIGHEKVQVLDGGLKNARESSIKISNEQSIAKKAEDYPVTLWSLPQVNMIEVKHYALQEDHIVVDVRDRNRYLGEIEPIDLIAGHIPGAINIPYRENLDENDCYLSPEKLKEHYHDKFKDVNSKNVIFHCGSGVTACNSILAVAIAGLDMPMLYVGSWSEWSRNDNEMITKEPSLMK
jgi:thiosulfate/3-mercaptopyruvate sulfurtransferase